jgi:hypothetical protein
VRPRRAESNQASALTRATESQSQPIDIFRGVQSSDLTLLPEHLTCVQFAFAAHIWYNGCGMIDRKYSNVRVKVAANAATGTRPTAAHRAAAIGQLIENTQQPKFLIGTPKRLEIDATQTKQTTELLSNRDKIAPLPYSRLTCSGLVLTNGSRDSNCHTKLLETGLTHSNQTTEVTSNRNKIDTLQPSFSHLHSASSVPTRTHLA